MKVMMKSVDEMAEMDDETYFDNPNTDGDEGGRDVDRPEIPYYSNPEEEEEMDLDAILAELDALDEEDPDEVTEAKEDEEAEEAEEGEKKETFDIEEMSEEDLIKFVEDVIKDMVEAGELEAGGGQPGEEGAEGDEDEIELDLGVEG
jgi:hypothetical protein